MSLYDLSSTVLTLVCHRFCVGTRRSYLPPEGCDWRCAVERLRREQHRSTWRARYGHTVRMMRKHAEPPPPHYVAKKNTPQAAEKQGVVHMVDSRSRGWFRYTNRSTICLLHWQALETSHRLNNGEAGMSGLVKERSCMLRIRG